MAEAKNGEPPFPPYYTNFGPTQRRFSKVVVWFWVWLLRGCGRCLKVTLQKCVAQTFRSCRWHVLISHTGLALTCFLVRGPHSSDSSTGSWYVMWPFVMTCVHFAGKTWTNSTFGTHDQTFYVIQMSLQHGFFSLWSLKIKIKLWMLRIYVVKTVKSIEDHTDLDSEIVDEEVENVMGKVCEG